MRKTANQENGEILSRLGALIKTYAPYDGSFETKIPGVYAIRRTKVNSGVAHGLEIGRASCRERV